MKYKPHPYQDHATRHILDNEACGLFLEMGLGKTVSSLTAIDELMYDRFEVNKVLVIAPKRVAEDTWSAEIAKWDHLKHLRLSKVLGTEQERILALRRKADIYIINRENVVWLIAFYGGRLPFDMWVIDELSSFKSQKAVRFKALRKLRPAVKRVVGLTGTPAPNSLLDLWPQVYLLDQGERLEKTVTAYREKYFEKFTPPGTQWAKYRPWQPERIYKKIGDICISMEAKDYLTLPEKTIVDVPVVLSAKVKKRYDDFEKEQVLAMEDVDDISAVNAAALTTKLLQFASGAVYDDEKNYHPVHSDKLEALEEIVEAANGSPVLVAYWFQHEKERILKHFREFKPEVLKSSKQIKDWNEGKIQMMLVHPASAGHGLNLQAGGNIIVWFSFTWSLELYLQLIARLHRQGQKNAVIIHRLVAKGTIDEDVSRALVNKDTMQRALLQATKAIIKKYIK